MNLKLQNKNLSKPKPSCSLGPSPLKFLRAVTWSLSVGALNRASLVYPIKPGPLLQNPLKETRVHNEGTMWLPLASLVRRLCKAPIDAGSLFYGVLRPLSGCFMDRPFGLGFRVQGFGFRDPKP